MPTMERLDGPPCIPGVDDGDHKTDAGDDVIGAGVEMADEIEEMYDDGRLEGVHGEGVRCPLMETVLPVGAKGGASWRTTRGASFDPPLSGLAL